jgi:hypothetical protein
MKEIIIENQKISVELKTLLKKRGENLFLIRKHMFQEVERFYKLSSFNLKLGIISYQITPTIKMSLEFNQRKDSFNLYFINKLREKSNGLMVRILYPFDLNKKEVFQEDVTFIKTAVLPLITELSSMLFNQDYYILNKLRENRKIQNIIKEKRNILKKNLTNIQEEKFRKDLNYLSTIFNYKKDKDYSEDLYFKMKKDDEKYIILVKLELEPDGLYFKKKRVLKKMEISRRERLISNPVDRFGRVRTFPESFYLNKNGFVIEFDKLIKENNITDKYIKNYQIKIPYDKINECFMNTFVQNKLLNF